MVSAVPLYNLDIGKEPQDVLDRAVVIDGFSVHLMHDYSALKERIYRSAYKSERVNMNTGEQEQTFHAMRLGQDTATASLVVADPSQFRSVLFSPDESLFSAVFDVTELLTFITGRRVSIFERLHNHLRTGYGYPVESGYPLQTLRVAWGNRAKLLPGGLNVALRLYNESMEQNFVPITAYLLSAALNIIVDAEPDPSASVKTPKATVANLKAAVAQAVRSIPTLGGDSQAYENILSARIDQGLGGLKQRMDALFVRMRVVEYPVTLDQQRRLSYVNTIRNGFVHSGRVDALKGIQDMLRGRATIVTVATHIMSAIVRYVLCERLGLPNGFERRALWAFFRKGKWMGFPVEEEDFMEWFTKPWSGSLF